MKNCLVFLGALVPVIASYTQERLNSEYVTQSQTASESLLTDTQHPLTDYSHKLSGKENSKHVE